MKTGFSVADAMTRRPIKIDPVSSVKDCAKLMKKESVGSVIVASKQGMVGIVTEQDIVYRVVADPKKKSVSVKDIMTKKVVTVEPHVDIYDALVLMRDKDVRTLPVVVEDHIVGMLTLKDIVRIEPDLFDLVVDKWSIREEKNKPVFGQGMF